MLITFSPVRDAPMHAYKQLTDEQRCQIYALKNIVQLQQVIAQEIGINQSSVSSVSSVSRESYHSILKTAHITPTSRAQVYHRFFMLYKTQPSLATLFDNIFIIFEASIGKMSLT